MRRALIVALTTALDPHNDKKIGKDNAASDGSWFVDAPDNTHGRFYAFAHKTNGCKRGLSKVITL